MRWTVRAVCMGSRASAWSGAREGARDGRGLSLGRERRDGLHVYNWVDHIGETTIRDFEARTGIKVVVRLVRRVRSG